ncbi:MAG: hypothetical protein ACLFSQ_01970 [Candidatus Zixiibacteriota bacterium]
MPVFPADEGYGKFPFPLLNWLHIDTKDIVLMRLLPFSPGDEISDSLINEYIMQGKRNLSNTSFISDAEIYRIDTTKNGLIITYQTWEMWSTKPAADLSYVAGQLEYSVELEEENLLGLGTCIEFSYGKQIDDYHEKLKIDIPPVLPEKYKFYMLWDKSVRMEKYDISLRRPSMTNYEKVLSGLTIRKNDGEFDHWVNGDSIDGSYNKDETTASFDLLHRLDNNLFVESSIGYLDKKSTFKEESRRHLSRRFILGMRYFKRSYECTDYIDCFTREEEIQKGYNLSLALDVDPFAKEDNIKIDASLGTVNTLGDYFLSLTASSEWSFYKRTNRIDLSLVSPKFLNTRIINSYTYKSIINGDIDDYYYEGSDNRLRGYSVHELVGEEYFAANIESRFFTNIEFFSIRPSIVLFFDSANFGKMDSFDDYHFGAGGGLRLSSTKASTIMRFEIATAIGKGSPEPKYIVVSRLPFSGILGIEDFIGSL